MEDNKSEMLIISNKKEQENWEPVWGAVYVHLGSNTEIFTWINKWNTGFGRQGSHWNVTVQPSRATSVSSTNGQLGNFCNRSDRRHFKILSWKTNLNLHFISTFPTTGMLCSFVGPTVGSPWLPKASSLFSSSRWPLWTNSLYSHNFDEKVSLRRRAVSQWAGNHQSDHNGSIPYPASLC